MDLKGSLVDTNLRIYPSKSLLNFMKSIPLSNDTPENLRKISDKELPQKTELDIDIEKFLAVPLNLNEQERVYLDTIKKELQENYKIKSNNGSSENKEGLKTEDGKKEECDIDGNPKQESVKNDENADEVKSKKNIKTEENHHSYLTTADIDWVYSYMLKRRSCGDNIPYLHEIFAGTRVEMPENKVLKRNPVLEARCVKLRAQQEAREYRQMTRGVDNVRMRFPEDSISYQMKQLNRQLIAILQFLISIFAGFLFGFKGLEWMLGNLDFGFRLLMGVMCALIIALAEIYFLAKKLNEELSVPETVQLGGPPKFVDETLNPKTKINSADLDKQHQD